MNNYKVKVNNEAESREVRELFFKMGYSSRAEFTKEDFKDFDGWICALDDGSCDYCPPKQTDQELTISQLRAMASTEKEYINKTTGEYRKTSEVVSGERWIEIPSDAECLTKCIDSNNDTWFLFWKGNYKICVGYDDDWCDFEADVKEYLSSWSARAHVLWQRPTQPEALPFVGDGLCIETATGHQLDVVGLNTHGARSRKDGESDISYRQYLMNFTIHSRTISQSLNDQYAEIEQVRQAQRENNHYFINVSDVDEVDFYEIAKRYNVADPAIQHILKKCLAIGSRGHKDLETDLRDILKTAKRALEINGFSL